MATFILPLVVFMLFTAFEPKPGDEAISFSTSGITFPYAYYPLIYAIKIALTIVSMIIVLPGYRSFPCRLSLWSIPVGVIGVVLWIVLCELPLAGQLLEMTGLGSSERSAYNPYENIENASMATLFLVIRFIGLAAVVPIIEEFFLRGFLGRFFLADDWWKEPFTKFTSLSLAVLIIAPLLMHPGTEWLAALVWFGLVTAMVLKTGNIWDAVLAHAITNLLLGIYVVYTGNWYLM